MNASERPLLCLAAAVLLSLSVAGCGTASGAPKGQVRGKIIAGGQPVTAGEVTFAPLEAALEAAPATGAVQPDGTFVLSTRKDGDGAAIGKHQVLYSAPPDEQAEWDGYGAEPPVKRSPYAGMVPKQNEVEIKAGDNEITIELVPEAPQG